MMNRWLILVFLISGSLVISTCRKDERQMLVETGSVSNILTTTADVSGEVLDLGDGATQYGHVYGTSPNPGITDTKTEYSSPAVGGFTSALTGLNPATKYYVKAYISRGKDVVYGSEISFSTASSALPELTTTAVTGITKTGAVSGGNITSEGGTPVTQRGVCWSTAANPVVDGSKTTNGTGSGAFASTIAGLTAGTKYYVRAYATNAGGAAYGNEISFTTLSNSASLPTVSIADVNSVTSSSAECGGVVVSDGGDNVIHRGVCWSKSPNPTILNFVTVNGSGTGTFSSSLTNLDPGTTYYIRAYATNNVGTSYSSTEYFFTTDAIAPTVTTSDINTILNTTAKSGGAIISTGGALITARGVCWSTSPNPVRTDNYTSEDIGGGGTGSYTSILINLNPKTLYYVRAYATNSKGTSYGDELPFTSLGPPSCTTTSASSLANTTVTLNGTVNAYNSSTTVQFQYGITPGYGTTVDGNPSNVTGLTETSVSVNITGLISGQIYHYRIMASNVYGPTSGSDGTFTTTVQDRSGNSYNIVQIGTQTWMRENLKTTRLNDGSGISNVTNTTSWTGLTTPGYCWYNNDDNYRDKGSHGALYNWYTVNTGKLCPDGWHVPGSSDWQTLSSYLVDNGYGYQGSGSDIAKSLASTTLWTASATSGTPGNDMASNNSSGYSGLPSGYRSADGTFSNILIYGFWWSTYSPDASSATARRLYYNYDSFLNDSYFKKYGYSVRCIRNY